MKSELMYSCKEATLLISKKEEGKLSKLQSMRLSLHVMMCRYCRRFEKQTKFLSEQVKMLLVPGGALSAAAKTQMEEKLGRERKKDG